MGWNIDVLNERYNILKGKVEECSDLKKANHLRLELENIQYLIDYYNGRKGSYKTTFASVIDERLVEEKRRFYLHVLPSLGSKLSFLEYRRYLPTFNFVFDTITEEELVKLTLDFFEMFDYKCHILLKDLLAQDQVNFARKIRSTQVGFSAYLPTFNTGYINALFNKHLSHVSCLAHECAHVAVELGSDEVAHNNNMYSALSEVYPLFVELVFLDFLKTTKHFKKAFNNEAHFWEELTLSYEYNASGLLDADLLQYKDGYFITKNNITLSDQIILRFVSRCLSYYLVTIYREKKSKEELNKFLDALKSGSEYSYFEAIDCEEIINAIKREFNYYCEEKSSQKINKVL